MKRRTMISSILVIVLCLGLISGSTFALFTSESKVNIAVTSGKVNIDAKLGSLKLYSADATLTEGDKVDKINPLDKTGTILPTDPQGAFAGTYYYRDQTSAEEFLNGGTATIETNTETSTQSLSIQKITPGDKVALDVNITNNSNVAIQYRVKVNVLSGLKLYEALVVKVDGVSLKGVQKVSNWTYLDIPATEEAKILTPIPVEVYLPLDVSDETLQNLSTSMQITVEAVQGNAKTTNEVLAQAVNAEVEVTDSSVAQVITDTDNLVTVTVPAAGISSSTTSLEVNVVPQDTASTIIITSLQETRSYDVEVIVTETNTVNSETITNKYEDTDNPVTIKLFVGTGLTGVKLYHKESVIENFTYDSTTGYITFQTGSFSEYTVVYNKEIAVETVNDQGSTITVYTPTEDAGVYETKEGTQVVYNEATNKFSDFGNSVARIGSVGYEDLGLAFVNVKANETIVLLKNIDTTHCFLYKHDYAATFDLNGFTLRTYGCQDTADNETSGYAAGGRSIRIYDGTLTIKNGVLDGRNYIFENDIFTLAPNESSKASGWGTNNVGGCVRIESGTAILTGLTMYNNDGWGTAVSIRTANGHVNMSNCEIHSVYGSCIDVYGDSEIRNCKFYQHFIQTNTSSAWLATCIGMGYGATCNVYNIETVGVVENDNIQFTEGQGVDALSVFSSGGTLNVYGGNFTGSRYLIHLWPAEDGKTPSVINIYDGEFNGEVFVENDPNKLCSTNIYGGTFDHDPTAYVDKLHYAVIDNGNGTWTVQKIKTYVYSIVPNADNTKATVTYKSDENANFIATEEVRYLTAKNLGTETTNTTFDIYCGDVLIKSGATFSNAFNQPGFSEYTDVLIGRNVLVLPEGNIYFTGDSYIYSDAIFMIGSTDGSGNPTTRLLATGTSNVGTKGLQLQSREATLPQRTYYFENIVFDGSAQRDNWGHLITMTSYPIDAEFKNVLFQNMKTSKTSVIGAWANQELSDGSFPTKNDNVGTDIRFTNVKVNNINKPIFQFQGFTKAEIDANPDCYSYISVVFDAVSAENCVLNNSSAYATQNGNNNYTYKGTHYYWTVNGVEVSNVEGTTVTLGTVTLDN